MSVKPLLAFGKLWLLLLLLSNPVAAKTIMADDSAQDAKTVTLLKADEVIHKDGLQPQVPSVRIISEHHAKPINFGYAALSDDDSASLVLGYVGSTQVLLQDANRCESVSRLIFPYHFFW